MKQSYPQWLVELRTRFGDQRVLLGESLAKYCNWRIGGPADVLVICQNTTELCFAIRLAIKHQTPYTILGFGANVLVSDKGIRGLVIINRAQRIEFLPEAVVEADSGTNLAVLAKSCAQQGIAGCEFLIGIPGTIGAAVTVNAGTRDEWISSIIKEVSILDDCGEKQWIKASDISFSYRHSSLKEQEAVVLCSRLQGVIADPQTIEEKMTTQLQVRKNQPTGPSAGSVFKNPAGDFAGRLIEESGLKGKQIGGAQISPKHANFIININNAKACDVQALIELSRQVVFEQYGIRLEEEISYLGEW